MNVTLRIPLSQVNREQLLRDCNGERKSFTTSEATERCRVYRCVNRHMRAPFSPIRGRRPFYRIMQKASLLARSMADRVDPGHFRFT